MYNELKARQVNCTDRYKSLKPFKRQWIIKTVFLQTATFRYTLNIMVSPNLQNKCIFSNVITAWSYSYPSFSYMCLFLWHALYSLHLWHIWSILFFWNKKKKKELNIMQSWGQMLKCVMVNVMQIPTINLTINVPWRHRYEIMFLCGCIKVLWYLW